MLTLVELYPFLLCLFLFYWQMSYNQHEPYSQSLFILTWRLYLSVQCMSGRCLCVPARQHGDGGVGGAEADRVRVYL